MEWNKDVSGWCGVSYSPPLLFLLLGFIICLEVNAATDGYLQSHLCRVEDDTRRSLVFSLASVDTSAFIDP